MPSFEQKYGTPPPTQGTSNLSQRERNHIRSKLGISNIANASAGSLYARTEETMQAFPLEIVDEARALYKALDELGDSTTKIQGGNRGLYVSESDDRALLRRELMNLILPDENAQNLSETVATVETPDGDDELTAIRVRYSNARRCETDEYGARE